MVRKFKLEFGIAGLALMVLVGVVAAAMESRVSWTLARFLHSLQSRLKELFVFSASVYSCSPDPL